MSNPPRTVLRADTPSSRQGCVELLDNPYYKGVLPLPRIPSLRKPGRKSRILAQRTEHASVGPRGMPSHEHHPPLGPGGNAADPLEQYTMRPRFRFRETGQY